MIIMMVMITEEIQEEAISHKQHNMYSLPQRSMGGNQVWF